jgi:hypothetical protein
MPSRLADCLIREGALPAGTVQAASARQAVYGGALDTALLELGALDESALWTLLSRATGAPVPEAALVENPDPGAAAAGFGAEWSLRCRGVPVGQHDGTLQMLCGDPIDEGALAEARAALELSFEVYVVPEVRLAAARLAVYGEPMPPRLVRLLARLMGAQPVRRWMNAAMARKRPPRAAPAVEAAAPAETPPPPAADGAAHAPVQAPQPEAEAVPAPAEFDISLPSFSRGAATPIGRAPAGGNEEEALAALAAAEALGSDGSAEMIEERLCRVAEDPSSAARLPALRALRSRLDHPRVRALIEKLRLDLTGPTEVAVLAADALAELRDPQAVPALLSALQGPAALGQTAHHALVEIAKQDFGQSRRRWTAWWERHGGEDRIEWLFEGLSHKSAEIRFSSSEELRLVTGEYFGYHFDLPKRERDEARARWQEWWRKREKK